MFICSFLESNFILFTFFLFFFFLDHFMVFSEGKWKKGKRGKKKIHFWSYKMVALKQQIIVIAKRNFNDFILLFFFLAVI